MGIIKFIFVQLLIMMFAFGSTLGMYSLGLPKVLILMINCIICGLWDMFYVNNWGLGPFYFSTAK